MIATLADPSDVLLASARLDPRRQAEPGRDVTRRLELPSVADRGDDRAGRHRPHSRRRGEPLALGTGSMPSQDAGVDRRDLFVEGIDMGEQAVECPARFIGEQLGVEIVHMPTQLVDPLDALAGDDAELGQ